MGFPTSSFFLVFFTLFGCLTAPAGAADIYSLVYKGCAKQSSSSISGFQDTLSALFTALIAQAASARFYKTSSGGGQSSVSGLFQCRGDISNADCYNCVHRLPEMAGNLCGQSVAGRVHLGGCYLAYQTAGFSQISGSELLYKMCGSSEAGGEFEEKRDTAFSQLQTGIAGGSGFYATTYSSVYAVAQCEGDLGDSDCAACVRDAIQRAEVECGRSSAGQVFLNRCYISYNYYPNGIHDHYSEGSEEHQTGKTVAIVLGGAAALGFTIMILLFVRSLYRRRDDY